MSVVRKKRRWVLLGGAFGAGLAAVVVSAVSFLATAGVAATTVKPEVTVQPTISGTPQEGKTLTGDRGDWSNSPSDFDYSWLRCNKNGGSCSTIDGEHSREYTLRSVDVGNTLRFRVRATNADGTTDATTVPTAVIVSATANQPVNTSPPTITGTPQQGKVLTGARGNWSNNPSDYNYYWLRCDRNGGSCATIGGAGGATKYTLTSADVGNSVRFRVQAKNADGATMATSVPTAVIQKVATTPPPPQRTTNGCPAEGGPDQVSGISQPARLLVDTLQASPRTVTDDTGTLVVRFHVTSSCGGPVQGALVYATATPYNQFAIPAEQPTNSNGWAELRFRRMAGFPVSNKQQLIAMFVRARKPNDNLLGGISTRRLVSVHVDLNR
jgi:hypothetical protein